MPVLPPASRKAVSDRAPVGPSPGDVSNRRRGTVTPKRVSGFVGLVFMAAVIAAFVSLAHAQGPNGPQSAPRPAQIDRNGVLILIRQSLLALDQANKTGNYTVLRDLGSPAFQANSAAFRNLRQATQRQ